MHLKVSSLPLGDHSLLLLFIVAQYTERQYDADNFMYIKQVRSTCIYPSHDPLRTLSSSSLLGIPVVMAIAQLIALAQGSSPLYLYFSSKYISKNVLCVGSVDLRDDASDDPIASNNNRVS